MKRVETIHINGIVFSIEDDAFGKLGEYLDALGKYFRQEQGGREIIADIEARISELFAERTGGASRVITLADVTKALDTLGTPEDIAGTDADLNTDSDAGEKPKNEKRQRPAQTSKTSKRLFRDPDQRYAGGVCAGLGAWLGISPVIIRLIIVLLVLLPFPRFIFGIHGLHGLQGTVFLAYFILWIIIPKARTTAQKLEMRGEPVNISNIEKSIRESFTDPSLKHSFRNFLDEAGEFFGKLFGIFGRLVGVLFGLILFSFGVCFAILLMSVLFMQDIVFNHWVEWDFLSFTELFRHIISPASYTILLIFVILSAALLIFALLFWGVKLMTGFHVKRKLLHVALFVFWIAAMVTVIMVCITQVRSFAWRNEQIAETMQIAPSDTLCLALAPSKLKISNNPMEIYFDKDNLCFYGKPNLRIQKSDDDRTKLSISRESRGESKRAAYQYAENIAYSVDISDSLLIFDPYFTVTPQDKWKFQTMDIILYVPEGTVIIADKALCHDRIFGRYFRWRSNNDCTWVMTKKGLQRQQEEQ